jgi:hypothetical protein
MDTCSGGAQIMVIQIFSTFSLFINIHRRTHLGGEYSSATERGQ